MFNGCVGIKPTPGKLSTLGVVPACKSLDCVSVFAQSVEDAAAAARIMEVPPTFSRDPLFLRSNCVSVSEWHRSAPRHTPSLHEGFRKTESGSSRKFARWDRATHIGGE